MHLTKNPEWLSAYDFPYARYSDIPDAVFKHINTALDRLQSGPPLVSIIVSAWNEEMSILKTIASIADNVAPFPAELIVVNNNSSDDTQKTLDSLHLRSVWQPVQGWGPARQAGLEAARGKYILLADADCYYPAEWICRMVETLRKPGVSCVYGRHSFTADAGFPRWKLALWEVMKDGIAMLRHIKRPFLNAYGMNMGFLRKDALKVGFVMEKIRGEDGRLCYDLMGFGKVVPVTADAARVWTGPRTLQRDGSFGTAMLLRIRKEFRRISELFHPLAAHDTKTSLND